jgi:hypothetical protein
MAVKSNFSDGTALPASDINTYLTNGGLVYVTSATVGTGVTSVSVTNCFSATYDAYKIIYMNGTGVSGSAGQFNLIGATSGWYGNLIYGPVGGGVSGAGVNNGAYMNWAGGCAQGTWNISLEVLAPFLNQRTLASAPFTDATNFGTSTHYLNNTTSYTGFTLAHPSGMTGGTITVYGYRKA